MKHSPTRRTNSASGTSPTRPDGERRLAIIILGGKEFAVDRFTIGQLKRMTEVVDTARAGGLNIIEQSRALVAIALERKYPDLKVADDLETDMVELNAAAATVIDIAGFVLVGKPKAVPTAA
jgi:hypothetical protein